MDDKIAISELLAKLEELEGQGKQELSLTPLATLLRSWKAQIETNSIATADETARQLEVWKVQSAASSASRLEMFKAVIESGQTALKASTVINGGAAAALLALLAEALKSASGSTSGPLLSSLGCAWFTFMMGLACAGLAAAARYASQALYMEESRITEAENSKRFKRFGNGIRNLAIALGLISFLCFIGGSVLVLVVMLQTSSDTTSAKHPISSPEVRATPVAAPTVAPASK